MHRKCKYCSICGKRAIKRFANHLADVHELSSEERQPYLIRANPTALDLENVLAESKVGPEKCISDNQFGPRTSDILT